MPELTFSGYKELWRKVIDLFIDAGYVAYCDCAHRGLGDHLVVLEDSDA